MSTEIDQEKDVIYGEPVTEIVSGWKWIVDINQKTERPFSMFWLTGPDNKITSALSLLAKEMGINKKSIIKIQIDESEWDLTRRLLQLADKIRLINETRIMLIAQGYENVLAKTTDMYRLSRAGHDWDQDVLEDSKNTRWGRLYREMGKHVVIATTISFSAGPEAYEKTVKSAAGSQFKDGILELKHG